MTELPANGADSAVKMNVLAKITNLFTNPVSVFENIKSHPTWIVPVLLVILFSMLFAVSTREQMVKLQEEAIYDSQLIPEEYKDRAIEELENKSEMRYYIETIAGSVVSVFVISFGAAAAFMLFGNFVFGGSASYKQNLAVYCWAGLVGIVEILLKLPLVISKGSLHVYTSLAILMDSSQSKTAMFQLLNAFDVFTIWKIFLWATGFGIIYKFSKAKSYSAILVLYGLYLAVTIGISQIF